MNKRFLLVPLVLVLLMALGLLLRFRVFTPPSSQQVDVSKDKVKVVVSFYPLEEVAKHVGQDLIEVKTITPVGTEPHEYEPTPQDVVALYGANLVLLNGNGVDAWGDKLMSDLHARSIKVIRMTDTMGGSDPHIWLDPTNVEKQADLVATTFAELDPAHALTYFAQRDSYKVELAALDQDYRTRLAQCPSREIVVTHDAFGYLARRYNLTTYHLLGLSPEEDPSPARLAEITRIAKQKKIKTVFFETLIDPRLANTLAKEIGGKTRVLYPIEGRTQLEVREGKTYVQFMRENLESIRQALGCS